MPTYEYKCDACGKTFEKFQPMSSAPVKKCPNCGKNKARRLIGTGAGLIFKGSGFYITDYRDSKYQEKAKADSGNSSSGGENKSGGESKSDSSSAGSSDSDAKPKTETKSESKPAAKSESKPAKSDKPAKPSK